MNTCKKVAFFENIASVITNKGDSQKNKQTNKQTKKNQQQQHPSSSNRIQTMTLWFTNVDRSSMTRRDDSAGVNWLQIIHTGQHRKMAFLHSNL